MASLSGNKIKDTYQSLIKLTDNGNLTTGAKQLTDGFGNNSPLYISTTQIGIGVTPEATFDLHVYQNAKVGGNLTITGDLTVNGTTTTVGTDTLSVKDPLIVLANNNTSADSVDIGFYGKYAPSGTTLYAGLFRDTGDNKFKLFRDLEEEPTTTVNTSGTGYTKAGLVIGGLEATTGSFADDITLAATKRLKYADEKIIIGNTNSTLGNQAISLGYDADSTGNQSIGIGYNPEASGTYSVAIGYNVTASGTGTFVFGTSGSHSDDNTLVASGLDLKVTGTGQSSFAGQVTIPATPSASTDAASKGYVDSQVGANNELSEVLANGNTTGGTDISVSSGDDITFADSSKSIYGAGSDLQIYSDGSYNYIHCTSNELRIRSNTLRLLNSAGTANYITADNLQAVQLYYNNSKKFETTSTGVTVTGAVSATTFSGQLDGTISSATTATTQSDGDNSTKVATTAYVDTAIQGHDTLAEVLVGGNTTGATKIEVNNTSSGIDFIDNAKARFGTDDDLEIYHNGTNAVIDNGTNNIVFNVAGKTIINSSSTDNELNLGHSSGNWFAKATNSNTLIIGSESNATNNITLDTTNGGSATFSGDVTVTGGDLTLGTDSIASNINAVGDVLGINVDSNTGGGAGANIQLKTAGTTQLTINSSSATFAGRVGIGQSAGTAKLEVAGEARVYTGSNLGYWGVDSGNSYVYFGTNTSGYGLSFQTSGSERVRIDSSGRVGINQTSPSSFFANASQLVIGDGSTSRGMTIYGSSAGDSQIFFADGVTGDQQYRGIFRYEHSSDAMVMFTSATEKMRIDSSGNVGIGGTPTHKLYVRNDVAASTDLDPTTIKLYNNNDGGSGIEFSNAVSANSKISFGVESTGAGTDDTFLAFSTSANTTLAERMRIDSNGSVSFGGSTTLSNTAASIQHFSTNGYLYIYGGTGGVVIGDDSTATRMQIQDNNDIWFETAGTERMRIDSSGTVSIGSSATSTDRRFQVTGTNTDLSATTTQFGIVNNPTYPNTITSNIYNLYTGPNVTSGATLTNLYNLYLEANNYSGSTVTNSYGLYQAGTSDKNYFAGNVGIGVTSPLGSSKLHVSSANGTAYTSNAQLRVSGGATNNNRATILFSDDALSDGKLSYYPASGTSAYFSLSARGTEADFIVKADGNVGIGLTSPAAKLEVYGNVQNNTTSIANSAAYIRGADVGIAIGQSASSPYGTWVQSQRNSDGVTFPLSLNPSGGNVGIGTTSPNAKLEIGSGQAKTVTSGVEWARFGTSNEASNYATLTCEVKGGATAADRKWIFQTIESGVANAGNIIFQPSGGNVGIGTDSPRNDANFVTLQVGNTTTGGSQIVLDDNDTNGPWRIISNQSLIINDDATERMRIDSSGNIKTGDNIKIMGTTFGDSFLSFSSNGNTVLKANDDVVIGYSSSLYVKQGGNVGIGTSLPGYMLHVQSNSSSTSAAFFRPNVIGSGDPAEPTTVFIDGQKAAALDINRFYSHGTIVNIRQNNSNVGSISVTGVATSYNTSSDYRLKENVVEMTDALDRVSQLKPSRFNFIGHEEIVDGFLAHEVSDIVPEAITGTKDEVDAEGNPVYQGIDQSKLVPLLVGAIQELQKRIEILENK